MIGVMDQIRPCENALLCYNDANFIVAVRGGSGLQMLLITGETC